MQYNKEQLSGKDLAELQSIAEDLGIKTSKLSEKDLIYAILDKYAVVSAAEKVANEKPSRKRQRVKSVNHVYSANQENAKKVDKNEIKTPEHTLFSDLSATDASILKGEVDIMPKNSDNTQQEENQDINQNNIDDSDISNEETLTEAPKKKRGRPKKNSETSDDTTMSTQKEDSESIDNEESDIVDENNIETPKKKRGRPKKEDAETDDNTLDMNNENETPENANGELFGILEDVENKNTSLDNNINNNANFVENPFNIINDNKPSFIEDGLDNGDDFIILEDIPNEDGFYEPAPQSMFEKFKQQMNDNMNNMDMNPIGNNMGAAPMPINNNEPMWNEPEMPQLYDFTDIVSVSGVLELTTDNYGFLRSSDYNYLPSPDDIYVNQSQVKHYGLKTGDVVEGTIRPPHDGEKYFPLTSIKKINGCDPSIVRDRVPFEYLTPLFPDEKFKLCSGKNDSPSSRIVDLFSPIGKGQRALIVAQPKTGKTLLMKDIANSIARNHPEAYLMMLLIDERPEEVTDMARTVNAEVIASTFDAPADNHVKIANLVLEKAKRMVECGHDVVIFLDSITRLARAYNTVSPASGKVLTGGVDANALQKPKRFFGAARNIEGGGSLTIIATALIDTGSKMDEVIFEEFKGTGNMELQLDRSLSNKRVFPAVNLIASSTRRDDLLQDNNTTRRMWVLRKHISDMTVLEAMDLVLNHIERTENNEEFLMTMNS